MSSIFISYSREDSVEALSLAAYLRTEGLEVWIDQQGIEIADQWGKQIVEAINNCATFLLLLSPRSVESHNVLKETMLASEKMKRIVPIELRPTLIPPAFEYPLAGIQRLAYTTVEDAARIVQGLPTTVPVRHTTSHGAARFDARKAVMVLPFEDLSPSQDNGWFADGLVSELISVLSAVKGLRLIDEHTTREYRKVKIRTVDLARELRVRYFVEGNVRKFGEQIKITVQLLDVEEGEYLWTGAHKGTFSDIFDIQEEVARKVLEGLKLTLTSDEEKRLVERGTTNPDSYALKLRSDEFARLQTMEGYHHSLETARQAMELDPTFVQTYHLQANAHTSLYRSYDRNPMHLSEAKRLSYQALEIAPTVYEPLSLLAQVAFYEGDLVTAEEHARRYVELEPNRLHSHMALAFFYYLSNQPQKAIEPLKNAVRIRPEELTAHSNLTATYDRIGDTLNAKRAALSGIPVFERHLRLRPDDEYARVKLANLYRYAENPKRGLEVLEPLKEKKGLDGNNFFNIACLYAVLGDSAGAFKMLHSALDQGFCEREAFQNDTDLKSLRSLPEYQELIDRLEGLLAEKVAA